MGDPAVAEREGEWRASLELLIPEPSTPLPDANVPDVIGPSRGLPEGAFLGRFCMLDCELDTNVENREEDEEAEDCLLVACLVAGGLKVELVGERTLREGLAVLGLTCDKG